MANIIGDLVYKITGDTVKLDLSLKKADEQLKKAAKATNPLQDALDRLQNKFVALFALDKLKEFGKALINTGIEYAKVKQSAEATASQFGVSADTIVKKLSEASDGTISNAKLIESANKVMALNVTKDVGQMAKLLEVARVRARSMGISTTQAFEDIATGIGRNSPLILDNLGIITTGWAEEAKSAGVAYDSQFVLNKVLQDGSDILKKTGNLTLTASERFDKLGATFDNVKIKVGEKLLPVLEAAAIGLENNNLTESDALYLADELPKLTETIARLGGIFQDGYSASSPRENVITWQPK